MADPRKVKKSEKTSADHDLAALLRASLDEQEPQAQDESITGGSKEEDELSRLLREQLERFGHPSSDVETRPSAYAGAFEVLDEFESAEETLDEPAEEIPEEPIEEISDEPIEEIPEEPIEEIFEEPVEEIPEEPIEEIPEEPVEEIPEEPIEEIFEEPIEEISDEPIEEIPEEPIEEIFEEPVEEIPEEPSKEIFEEFFEDILHEDVPRTEKAVIMPLHEFMAAMSSDDESEGDDYEINGRTPKVTLEDALCSELDEETQRALHGESLEITTEHEDASAQTPTSALGVTEAEDILTEALPSESKDAVKPLEIHEASAPVWHDPLQLTLDTIRTIPQHVPKSKSDAVTRPTPNGVKTTIEADASNSDDEILQGYAVTKAEESRDRDTELYLHLGYEKDVEQMEDMAHIQRVSNQFAKEEYHRSGKSGLRNTSPAIYDGEEYLSPAQTCDQERAYSGAQILCKVRLWLTLAFSLVGVAFDILPDIAELWGAGLEAFTVSRYYPMLGFAWLMIACLPSASQLWRGMRSLWEMKPVLYAIPATALMLSLAHTAMAFFLSGQGIRLYIGGSLLLLFLACLADCFKTAAEHLSFRVASSGKAKYVVTKENDPALSEADELTYARSFRVRRVERLSDYFLQVTQYDRKERHISLCIVGAFLGALAIAGVVIVMGEGAWISGLSAFCGTYLAVVPGTYLIMLTLPLLLVNRRIGRHGCAVLTPEATETYAPGAQTEPEAMHLYFSAGDVLKASHIKAVTMAGDDRAGDYRRQANRLFALLNFSLCDEDFPVREETLKGIHLEIAEADETCLRLYMVDPSEELACEVLMGTYEALLHRGIRLPKNSMERVYKRTEDSRVLYLAFDRKFRLAYSVKYRPRRSFAQAVKSLAPLGYVLSVISYNPLVTKELLNPLTTGEQPHIELIRPATVTEERESRSCSILATGRAVDVVYPLTACRHLKSISGRAKMMSRLAMIISFAALALLLGLGLMSHISTLILWGWQLAWMGISWFYIRMALRSARLSMTEKTP